jgi:hypothetical protein
VSVARRLSAAAFPPPPPLPRRRPGRPALPLFPAPQVSVLTPLPGGAREVTISAAADTPLLEIKRRLAAATGIAASQQRVMLASISRLAVADKRCGRKSASAAGGGSLPLARPLARSLCMCAAPWRRAWRHPPRQVRPALFLLRHRQQHFLRRKPQLRAR